MNKLFLATIRSIDVEYVETLMHQILLFEYTSSLFYCDVQITALV